MCTVMNILPSSTQFVSCFLDLHLLFAVFLFQLHLAYRSTWPKNSSNRCTFTPFDRCRHPKPIVIKWKSISHYCFWNFCSKMKCGNRVPLSILAPKLKRRNLSSLFVLELPHPNRKAKSLFHYLFQNFCFQFVKAK